MIVIFLETNSLNYGNPIVTGLASYGMSGRIFHAPFLDKNSRFDFKYVLQRTKNDALVKYPSVEIVRSYQEMLAKEDIELVVVNTPSYLHYEMTKAALKAGKHVVVEKPFTSSYQEAEELIHLAKKQGVLLTVYHNKRLEGDYNTIKKLIDSNQLGELKHLHMAIHRFRPQIGAKKWKEDGRPAGGLLYDMGSHMIDQTLNLFGEPKNIEAQLDVQREGGRVIDFYDINFQYSGFDVRMVSDMLTSDKLPSWKLIGSNATFTKFGVDPQEQNLSQDQINWETVGEDIEENYGLLHVNSREEVVPTLPGNYMEFYSNLSGAIRKGNSLLVTPQQAAEVIKCINRVTKSMGMMVRV